MTFLSLIVAISVWLTPTPSHSKGWLVSYGPQTLVEQVAQYRGYDLSPYPDRCGVSLISPTDLGKLVWLRQSDGSWFGPCLSIDSSSRKDYEWIVYHNWEVAEVPFWLAEKMGFQNGEVGEIYVGRCPPSKGEPLWYHPKKIMDGNPFSVTPSMYPYPTQEYPVGC